MEKTNWWNGMYAVEDDQSKHLRQIGKVVGFTGKHYVVSSVDVATDGTESSNPEYWLDHLPVKGFGEYGNKLFGSFEAAKEYVQ